jgi:hypothetical protein
VQFSFMSAELEQFVLFLVAAGPPAPWNPSGERSGNEAGIGLAGGCGAR